MEITPIKQNVSPVRGRQFHWQRGAHFGFKRIGLATQRFIMNVYDVDNYLHVEKVSLFP